MHHVTIRWTKPSEMSLEEFERIRDNEFKDMLLLEFQEWIYQHENTVNNHHLHAYGHFKGTIKKRPKSCAIHYNAFIPGSEWQPVHKVNAILKYVKKDETRVAGPWYSDSLKQKIESMIEAPVYEGNDIKHLQDHLYPWQAAILFDCENKPHDRTVNVLVDEKGGAGKSSFTKYCKWKYGSKFFGFGYEKAGNMMHMVAERVKKDPNMVRTFFIDLSRSRGRDNTMQDVMEAIEKIKNGDIQSGKYGGTDVQFQTPHVWVFTNEKPDLRLLSADRWKLWKVASDKSLIDYNKEEEKAEEGFGDDFDDNQLWDELIDQEEARHFVPYRQVFEEPPEEDGGISDEALAQFCMENEHIFK